MLAHLVALSMVAGAPGYGSLAADARTVNNLGRLLEGYLEDCDVDTPGFDREGCRERVKAARAELDGARLKVEVDVAGRLRLAGWDARKEAYRLHLVPLFDARGLGLSVGKPRRVDAKGRPVVKNIPIWVKRAKGEPEAIFERRLARGMVRLELLVEPRRAWRIRRKGDDDLRGLDVKLVGLRLYAARGGEVLAEQTYGRR